MIHPACECIMAPVAAAFVSLLFEFYPQVPTVGISIMGGISNKSHDTIFMPRYDITAILNILLKKKK